MPQLLRQRTEQPIRFGEVVLVQLQEARHLPSAGSTDSQSTTPNTSAEAVQSSGVVAGSNTPQSVYAVVSGGPEASSSGCRSDPANPDRNGALRWPSEQLFGFFLDEESNNRNGSGQNGLGADSISVMLLTQESQLLGVLDLGPVVRELRESLGVCDMLPVYCAAFAQLSLGGKTCVCAFHHPVFFFCR